MIWIMIQKFSSIFFSCLFCFVFKFHLCLKLNHSLTKEDIIQLKCVENINSYFLKEDIDMAYENSRHPNRHQNINQNCD